MNIKERLVEKFGSGAVSLIPKMIASAGTEELAADVVSCMIPDTLPSVIHFKTILGDIATTLTPDSVLADPASVFYEESRVDFSTDVYFTSLPYAYLNQFDTNGKVSYGAYFSARSDKCAHFDMNGRYLRVDNDPFFFPKKFNVFIGTRLALFNYAKTYYTQLVAELRKVFPTFIIEDEVEITYKNATFIFTPKRVPTIPPPSNPEDAFMFHLHQLENMSEEQLKALLQHNHFTSQTKQKHRVWFILQNGSSNILKNEINRLALKFIKDHPGSCAQDITDHLKSLKKVEAALFTPRAATLKNWMDDFVEQGILRVKIDESVDGVYNRYKYSYA